MSTKLVSQLLFLWSFGLMASAAFAQSVIAVGGSGSTPEDLQAAIDAAQPGDTLLIQGGVSGIITRVNKPLRLLGDGGTAIGNIVVENVHSGEVVIGGFLLILGNAVRVQNCSAPVWLERLFTQHNVEIVDSPDVTIAGATLGGSNAEDLIPGEIPSYGLEVRRSRVTLTDCVVNGRPATPFGMAATAALFADESEVHAVGCVFEGGGAVSGTIGGPGAQILASASLLARGCSFDQGSGAQPVESDPGATVSISDGPVHTLDLPLVVREGESISLEVSGPEGHLVALGLTHVPGIVASPFSPDLLAIGAPTAVIPLGILSSSPLTLTCSPVPMIDGISFAAFFGQVVALDPGAGEGYVGAARVMTLLDSAF